MNCLCIFEYTEFEEEFGLDLNENLKYLVVYTKFVYLNLFLYKDDVNEVFETLSLS